MAAKTFAVTYGATITKKIVMALTGLIWVLFVVGHMVGNLYTFVLGGSDAFNLYTYKLTSLGPLLWFIEIALALFFIFHIWSGISVTLTNWRARPVNYRSQKSRGEPSKQTLSSKTMIWTGLIILVFVVFHVWTFKYGPWYTTVVDGVEMRDLYRLVKEIYMNPAYAFGYVLMMIILAYHIRHAFWSAFQSLGANNSRYSGMLYALGFIIAIVLVVGFSLVPMSVYFNLV
jgi:succinate dehydrogenase / fumarate reductase cytochrome b subunit